MVRRQFCQIEIEWAIQQMNAAGLLNSDPDGKICLTDAGYEACESIEYKLNVSEIILLMMFYGEANSLLKES